MNCPEPPGDSTGDSMNCNWKNKCRAVYQNPEFAAIPPPRADPKPPHHIRFGDFPLSRFVSRATRDNSFPSSALADLQTICRSRLPCQKLRRLDCRDISRLTPQRKDPRSHRWNTDQTRILRTLLRMRVSSVFNPWLNSVVLIGVRRR